MKARRHWPLCGEFTGEFSAQMASNAENVSIWWRHHDDGVMTWTRILQYCFFVRGIHQPWADSLCKGVELPIVWDAMTLMRCHCYDRGALYSRVCIAKSFAFNAWASMRHVISTKVFVTEKLHHVWNEMEMQACTMWNKTVPIVTI